MALGLALLGAACAGSSDEAAVTPAALTTAGTDAVEAVDPAAYDDAANAACRDGEATFALEVAALTPGATLTPEDQRHLLDAFVSATSTALDELDALVPPVDRAAAIDDFVSAARDTVAEAAAADPAEFATVGSDDAAIQSAVLATGLDACIAWVVGT